MSNKINLSIVVPVFNEQDNVKKLHEEVVKVLSKLDKSYEIIFVNDGSRDKTLENCKGLRPLKIINFRRNFGQTASLDAGFKEAKGEIVIAMDGDLQDDPANIPGLLKKMREENLDVVSSWRRKRKDPWSKRLLSRGADFLRKMLINDGVHDSGCQYRAYKKECLEKLDLMGEMHRFIPATLIIKGFRVGEIEVNHRPRIHGVTKYNYKRLVKGFLDVLGVWFWMKYASRPLHLFGGAGLFSFILGAVVLIALFAARIFYAYSLSDKVWPLLAIFLMMVGVQLFVSGLMADILVKSRYQGKNMNYSVKEVIENE
ncbi:MAG: glycosyltransferase family 2 protein [Candidatus Moraniibacteriota bacterium]